MSKNKDLTKSDKEYLFEEWFRQHLADPIPFDSADSMRQVIKKCSRIGFFGCYDIYIGDKG